MDIDNLRNKIDIIDDNIIKLLYKRLDLCKQIGEIKKEKGIDIYQPGRWELIENKLKKISKNYHIDIEFIIKLYNIIHEESIKIQK